MSKVVSMFNGQSDMSNEEKQYAKYLLALIEPFKEEFEKVDFAESIIEFGMSAWNMANIKEFLPDDLGDRNYAENLDATEEQKDLLRKVVAYKEERFDEHGLYFTSYEWIEKGGKEELVVELVSGLDFMTEMLGGMDEEGDLPEGLFDSESLFDNAADYDEGFVLRTAIILKPLAPYINWVKESLGVDFDPADEEMKDFNSYLVAEDLYACEDWIEENYENMFALELADWAEDESEWPQNRTYEMFQEWFDIEYSSMIYDFEKRPISKM